jgi:hypothetical protein
MQSWWEKFTLDEKYTFKYTVGLIALPIVLIGLGIVVYLGGLTYGDVLYAPYLQQVVDEQCGIGVAQVRWEEINHDPILSWSNGEITCYSGFENELTCNCS